MSGSFASLAFEASQSDRADNHTLRNQEDDDSWQCSDDRASHQLAVLTEIIPTKLYQCNRQRHHIASIDDDVRPGEVVPVVQEREYREGGDCAAGERHDDRPQDAQSTAAVNARGILQLGRNTEEEQRSEEHTSELQP